MADDKKHQAATTAKEQAIIFARAREIIEKINPHLEGVDLNDRGTALQLLLAKTAVQMGKSAEQMLELVNHNLPEMVQMWLKAYADVAQAEQEEATAEVETDEEAPQTEAAEAQAQAEVEADEAAEEVPDPEEFLN